jgi:predicted RNA-binding protein Jag
MPDMKEEFNKSIEIFLKNQIEVMEMKTEVKTQSKALLIELENQGLKIKWRN